MVRQAAGMCSICNALRITGSKSSAGKFAQKKRTRSLEETFRFSLLPLSFQSEDGVKDG